MLNKLKKNNDGFTIIEVMIVLAIAGLIMLIVFLAVPALQRNARNTQRTNDASKVGQALNECLSNKNSQISACDTTAELQALGLDLTKLQQLSTVNVTAGAPGIPANTTSINVGYGVKCNAAGDATAGGTARQAAGVYRIEVQGTNTGTPRCIEF